MPRAGLRIWKAALSPGATVGRAGRSTKATRAVAGKSKKGKPHGAITKRWRNHFSAIELLFGKEFTVEQAIETVKGAEDREMRPSEVRRLFQNSVDNGNLELVSEDNYRMTPKLIELIRDGEKHEGPSDDTKGPSVGGVAEWSNAADSKSDGADRNNEAPVGSNPTASAPSNADIFGIASLVSPGTTTPNE